MKVIKRFKTFLKENKENQNKILTQTYELEWAQIYHDSIRGKEWLKLLPLNIGRWAGNYTFFYVLNRVLNDYKPKSILEFGLGESTKFISAYLDHFLNNSTHLVIEQDENWRNHFTERFNISKHTEIKICPLEKREVKGFESNFYQNLDQFINDKFDLYVIDGPLGSEHYSRYDLMEIANKLKPEDDFIIILDDFDRGGEKETVNELLKEFRRKRIRIYENSYIGNKIVKVIATHKYRFASSL